MNLNFVLLLIILFVATFLTFGVIVAINIFLNSRTIQKWRNIKINYKTFIAKNVIIKFLQIFLIATFCIFLMVLPQINLFKDSGNLVIISLFYLPILCSIGLILSGWMSVIISVILSIAIVVDYAIISINDSDFLIWTIYQICILLFFNIGIVISRTYKKNLIFSFIAIISTIEFTLVYLLDVIFFLSQPNYMLRMFIQTTFVWVVYLIIYQCMLWIYQFTNKIKSIDNSKLYENKYFINSNNVNNYLHSYIKNNNINFGIIIIFDLINFNRLPHLWGNSVTKYIKNLVLDDLVSALNSMQPVFFMTKSNEYGCFINLQEFKGDLKAIYDGNNKQIRASNDAVRPIQNKMINLPKNISYKNKIEQIYAGGYASLYGIHSYDLDQLLDLCTVTKQKSSSIKRGIVLDVYNPGEIKLDDPIVYKPTINNEFLSKDFQISLNNKKITINDLKVYTPSICCVNKMLFNIDEIKTYALNKNIYNSTLRIIGMQTLKQFVNIRQYKKSCIIIDYPLNFVISNQFSLGDFRNKLQVLNLEPENIILKFDLSENQNLWIDNKNLINLKNLGIKTFFTNVNENNIVLITDFKPDFINFISHKSMNNSDLLSIDNILKKLNIKSLIID